MGNDMATQTETTPQTALGDIRVLDLTGPVGVYCGKLLADLGADVIRIEPPQGHPLRRIGPFYHDEADTEKSLYHFHVNTNKRGVTLDIEHPDGQQLFRKLVRTADVVVESFDPGYMDSLNLGYADLAKINPGLIMTSITPFGQTGPFRHFKGPNIVGDAAGGLLYVSGLPDGPPLVSAAEQGFYMAGAQGATGTLIALFNKDMTGEGQYIDVSMQESIATTVQPQAMFWPAKKEVPVRNGHGPRTRSDPILRDTLHRAKDGWVTGLGMQDRSWAVVLAWLQEEGAAEDLADPQYQNTEERMKYVIHVQDVLARFAAARTMTELMDGGQRRHLFIMPMFTTKDIVNDTHLKARGFFATVEHPELGESIVYPGGPYMLSETPWRIARRAPLLGEHNLEIYHQELGIPKERLALLMTAGAI